MAPSAINGNPPPNRLPNGGLFQQPVTADDVVFDDADDAAKRFKGHAENKGYKDKEFPAKEFLALLGNNKEAIQFLIDKEDLRGSPVTDPRIIAENGGRPAITLNVPRAVKGLEEYFAKKVAEKKPITNADEVLQRFIGGVKEKGQVEGQGIAIDKPETSSTVGTLLSGLPLLLPIGAMLMGGESSILLWIVGIIGTVLMANTGAGQSIARFAGKLIPGIGPEAHVSKEASAPLQHISTASGKQVEVAGNGTAAGETKALERDVSVPVSVQFQYTQGPEGSTLKNVYITTSGASAASGQMYLALRKDAKLIVGPGTVNPQQQIGDGINELMRTGKAVLIAPGASVPTDFIPPQAIGGRQAQGAFPELLTAKASWTFERAAGDKGKEIISPILTMRLPNGQLEMTRIQFLPGNGDQDKNAGVEVKDGALIVPEGKKDEEIGKIIDNKKAMGQISGVKIQGSLPIFDGMFPSINGNGAPPADMGPPSAPIPLPRGVGLGGNGRSGGYGSSPA